MKILHLDSSIQGDTSVSRQLSAAVIDRLRNTSEDVEVHYHDLASDPIPHLTLARLGTAVSAPILDALITADMVVIGAPMYNFGIASQLKAWFDHIIVTDKTFREDAEGVQGLMGGKRVIVAMSRGWIYTEGPAAASEHAESHLRAMLSFIGIDDPVFVIADGTTLGKEQRQTAIDAALGQIDALRPSLALV